MYQIVALPPSEVNNLFPGAGGDGASEPGRTPADPQPAGRTPRIVTPDVSLAHDFATTERFAAALMLGGVVLELRSFRAKYHDRYIVPADYNTTYAGWFDRPDQFAAEAFRAKGVSVFTTFNRINPELRARSYNAWTRQRNTTKDDDVTAIRWLFLDVDPERPADVSATEAERAAALRKRDAIIAAIPGLEGAVLTGSSGNGAYALVRIKERPNDEVSRNLGANGLKIVGRMFDDAAVKIDQKTKNPSRIMAVAGSIKCKGSDIPERPWRIVTLDAVPDDGAVFDLDGFVAAHRDLLVESDSQARGKRPARVSMAGATLPDVAAPQADLEARLARAEGYIETIEPAVAGQHGHDQTFYVACVLIWGFGLTVAQALALMRKWNAKCDPPWSEAELQHKAEQAAAKHDPRGRGYLLNDPLPAATQPTGGGEAGGAVEALERTGWEDNPHDIAREYVSENHYHADGPTIRERLGETYVWDGEAYRPLDKAEHRASVSRHASARFETIYFRELAEFKRSGGDGKKRPRPIPVTRNLVTNVIDAIASLPGVTLPAARYPNTPCWIDDSDNGPPGDYLPMRNAVVHLPSYFAGNPCTRKPTPSFFNLHSLGYDWNPDAEQPFRWLKFLDEVFPGDPESIDCLQEWMGLQVVPDVEFQKAACFLGESRGGKGTVAAIMKDMIGPANHAAITLSSFNETFGLELLIGKLSAIIDDARISARHDHATIAGRLLSITGAGNLAIPRKFRPSFDGVLTARLTILSNELPKIEDAAGVLPKRFIVLRFGQSFAGREDLALKESLKQELPGILIWSLEGLRRLKARGRFVPPKSGLEMHDEMKGASLAAKEFVEDHCIVGPGRQCDRDAMFSAWTAWSERVGRKGPGTAERMVREIRAVAPDVKAHRHMVGGRIVRALFGIDLLPPSSLVDPNSPF